VRKWKRVEGADGPRFRSALAAHEADLLRSLVTSMLGMLDDRESSSPADELEEITGMKTGNSRPPEDETMKRLLPDFYRAQTDHPAGSGTLEISGQPTSPWKLETGSGDIALQVGSSARFTLDAQTGSGSIKTDLPLTMRGSLDKHHVNGTVNGGGPTIKAETGSGDIRIQ